MKKTLRLVGVAAMVLLLAASCKKEEKNNGEKQMMTFSAGIEQTGAKTGLLSNGDHAFNQVWTDGDRINVNGNTFNLKNGAESAIGIFTGEVALSDQGPYYAFYPAPEETQQRGDQDFSKVTFEIPAIQVYAENSYATNLAPMAAKATDKNLSFTNLCGLMELSLMGDGITVTSLKLSCNKPICGQTAEYTIGGDAALAMPTDAPGNAVTMNCKTTDYPNGVTLNGTTPTSFIFVLPPVTEGDFTLTVTYSGGTQTITLPENISIVAGEVVYNNDPYKIEAGSSAPDGFVDFGTHVGGADGTDEPLYWATCNVGATHPQDYGNYYAWGFTSPQTDEGIYWGIYGYNFGYETSSGSFKVHRYCHNSSYWEYKAGVSFGTTMDGKAVLIDSDDVAYTTSNGLNRMPTKEEYDELKQKAFFVWTSNYKNTGVHGCVVYVSKDPNDRGFTHGSAHTTYSTSSDVHIFIPAGGNKKKDSSGVNVGTHAKIWTKSLYSVNGNNDPRNAIAIGMKDNKFIDGDDYDNYYQGRCISLNIRPVREQNPKD